MSLTGWGGVNAAIVVGCGTPLECFDCCLKARKSVGANCAGGGCGPEPMGEGKNSTWMA